VSGEATALGIPDLADAVEIGRGGFAVVYRATQPAFRRQVAAKVLTVELDERARLRFERECQALGSLSDHPGIVTVYSAGFTDRGQPYLLMPYLAGGSYEDLIRQRGALPWAEVADVGVRLADALAAAHAEGVLHRDLKPANVLRSRHGQPVLADFGIARVAGSQHTSSGTSGITGSVHYMAPELIDGQEPSVATDVYALGATLYALLSGRAAFSSDTDHGIVPVLHRIVTAAPPPVEGVPPRLGQVVLQAMAKRPEDRPPTAEALGRALQAAQQDLGLPVTPMSAAPADVDGTVRHPISPAPPVPDAGPRPAPAAGGRRRGAVLAAAVGGLALVAAIGAGALLATRGGGDVGAGLDPAALRPDLNDGVSLGREVVQVLDGEVATHEQVLRGGVAHLYAADLEEGHVVRVRAVGGDEDVDPLLEVIDPAGAQLGRDDDGGGGLSGRDSLLDLVVPASGTYAVVVSPYDAAADGPYRVEVRRVTPGSIAVGDAVDSTLEEFDLDAYALELDEGQTVDVSASADFDAELVVHTPDGHTLEDDDSGGGLDPALTEVGGVAGTYLVGVRSHSEGTGGAYTLAVTGR
jgi:serine/threonine-protein kinase PknK